MCACGGPVSDLGDDISVEFFFRSLALFFFFITNYKYGSAPPFTFYGSIISKIVAEHCAQVPEVLSLKPAKCFHIEDHFVHVMTL